MSLVKSSDLLKTFFEPPENSSMKRQEHYFGLRLITFAWLFCLLALLGCAPTKVQLVPRGTPPERPTSKEMDRLNPPSEKPAAEKIPTVRPVPERTYDETVSEWKSYQDLVKWMENDFSFDKERYEKFVGTLPVPRTPQETFQLRSGIYIDAATFLKETLNRINPSYKGQIVILIIRRHGFNHYACSFSKGG
jgi:hypothetical protein